MSAKKKMFPLSKLYKDSEGIDSVKQRRIRNVENMNVELLQKCSILWDNLSSYREARARNMRYVYNDQWSDMIQYHGEVMTERKYISMRGNVPLTNNVMRRLVNNVTGLYVKSDMEPIAMARDRDEQKVGEMMTTTLQCNWQINKMRLLLVTQLEEYLIGGAAFDRETFDFFNGKKDVLSTTPNPNYMFFDSSMSDPRFWDISLIGQIHDLTFKELISTFSKSEEDFALLKDLYSDQVFEGPSLTQITEKHELDRANFYTPFDRTLCRVYEIWTKESKPMYLCHDPEEGELFWIETDNLDSVKKQNEYRSMLGRENGIGEDEIPYITYEYKVRIYWYYQFLTPNGVVLLEGETPFEHESHPYVLTLYPAVNGEIHSFVADFLDQQRYINRLITIDDFVRRTGAKGVTMVPSQVIPEGMTPEEFAEQFAEIDGMIVYTAKPGIPEPKQVFSSSVHLNTAELVQLQLSFMEDISSVHGALQGKSPYSGTSGALYSQQYANSTVGLATLLLKFSSFVEDIAVKKCKLIQQYYTNKRTVNIAGKTFSGVKEYDPNKARDIEFDFSIKESASTPVHRMMSNDMLLEFWKAGAITLEMLLENGDFPFADSLLQELASKEENMQQIDPQIKQQVQSMANQNNVQNAYAMLNKA